MERISAGFFSSVATAPALDQEDDKVFSFYDQIILLLNSETSESFVVGGPLLDNDNIV